MAYTQGAPSSDQDHGPADRVGGTEAAARHPLTEAAYPNRTANSQVETMRRFGARNAGRDRLRFGFCSGMPRKGSPFLHAVGECRDTWTGWLRGQSGANPSPTVKFPVQRENIGNCAILSAWSVFQAPEKPGILRISRVNSLSRRTGNFSRGSGKKSEGSG